MEPANSSLPVPESPEINIELLELAIFLLIFFRSLTLSLLQTIESKVYLE